MEDIKEKNIVTIIRIIVIIIVLTIIGIIGYNYYKKNIIKKTTKNFKNYINSNYEIDSNEKIYYIPLEEKHILTKVTKLNDKDNSNVAISFNEDKSITGTLEIHGKNNYGINGVSYLKSTLKNDDFDCQIISNKGYTARCDLLKKYTEEFKTEIKEIFKKAKINPNYVKTKTV